jgi:hypothetical protein
MSSAPPPTACGVRFPSGSARSLSESLHRVRVFRVGLTSLSSEPISKTRASSPRQLPRDIVRRAEGQAVEVVGNGSSVYFFSHRSQNSFTVPGPLPAEWLLHSYQRFTCC